MNPSLVLSETCKDCICKAIEKNALPACLGKDEAWSYLIQWCSEKKLNRKKSNSDHLENVKAMHELLSACASSISDGQLNRSNLCKAIKAED